MTFISCCFWQHWYSVTLVEWYRIAHRTYFPMPIKSASNPLTHTHTYTHEDQPKHEILWKHFKKRIFDLSESSNLVCAICHENVGHIPISHMQYKLSVCVSIYQIIDSFLVTYLYLREILTQLIAQIQIVIWYIIVNGCRNFIKY